MRSFAKELMVLCVIFSVLGCAARTELTKTWKDSQYAGGKINRVMVIAITKKAGKRNLFENEFARQFEEHGVEAYPSSAIIPKDGKITTEAVKTALHNAGIDSVFAMKLIEKKEEEVYSQPQVNRSHGYMGPMAAPTVSYVPGYYQNILNVKLESTLYEAEKGKLIWSAISETYNPESAEDVLISYKKKIMKDLKQQGFID